MLLVSIKMQNSGFKANIKIKKIRQHQNDKLPKGKIEYVYFRLMQT
uniref:Uncharacterized protein n=1 Tax=Arundo donax TaxID=35708 RepID=A0A0A9H522_ARUDO